MSDFGDFFKFEKFLGQDRINSYKKDPERLFLGINTPFESSVWGGVLGKKYSPTMNMTGGPTEQQAQGATARGIDSGPGEKVHTTAGALATILGGMNAMNAMGGVSSGSTGAGTGAMDAGLAGGGEVGSGYAASAPGWGSGFGGSAAAGGKSAPMWSKFLPKGGMGGGQGGPKQLQWEDFANSGNDAYIQALVQALREGRG